jgi:D-alanyl-D-alanine carboxypeptidase
MRASSFIATMLSLILTVGAASSCAAQKNKGLSALPPDIRAQAQTALSAAAIGDADRGRIIEEIGKDASGFAVLFREVHDVMKKDPDLLRRVDKKVALPADFVPSDLVSLDGAFPYVVSKKGMQLRAPARAALVHMAEAAREEGKTLVVSSAYRSYDYQVTVFARNVQEMGKIEAERVSAPPGMSQHQLGTAIDFGSITDEFGDTAAGRWLSANAGKFGFSLSFPRGREAITGYRWESWHYRYISPQAAALQERFFLGVQQYLIEFLAALPQP